MPTDFGRTYINGRYGWFSETGIKYKTFDSYSDISWNEYEHLTFESISRQLSDRLNNSKWYDENHWRLGYAI